MLSLREAPARADGWMRHQCMVRACRLRLPDAAFGCFHTPSSFFWSSRVLHAASTTSLALAYAVEGHVAGSGGRRLSMMRLFAAAALCLHATALTTPQPRVGKVAKVTATPSAAVDVSRPAATLAALATATTPLASYAAAPAWVEPVSNVLDPCFFIIQFIMLLRVIISWFPETDVNEMPWVLVCAPTEGLLKITRDIVPPSFGVDISPVVWIAVASFLREILLGQQGILVLMAQGRM